MPSRPVACRKESSFISWDPCVLNVISKIDWERQSTYRVVAMFRLYRAAVPPAMSVQALKLRGKGLHEGKHKKRKARDKQRKNTQKPRRKRLNRDETRKETQSCRMGTQKINWL